MQFRLRQLHFDSKLIEIVSLFELVHTATGVNQLLFAGEVRMAFGANFYSEFVALFGGAGLECVTASADDVHGVVLGMDTFFHFCSPNFDFYTHTRRLRVYDIKFLYYNTFFPNVKQIYAYARQYCSRIVL